VTTINKEGKFPSTQLVSVMFLISQDVSTSEGHFQASGVKYIKWNTVQFYYALN
jgi:hypothetical protein